MIIKSLVLIALIVASFIVCSKDKLSSFLKSGRNSSSTYSEISFKKYGACNVPQLTYDTVFTGGATTGEEITVSLDTTTNIYRISIDASESPIRQGTVRAGRLIFNPDGCNYIMSGEKSAQVAINPRGVLMGGMDDDDADEPPAAIIAFKDTSTQLRDLAGNWWVSGRETDTGIIALSRPVPAYEMTIQSSGRFSNCSDDMGAKNVSCIRGSGSLAPHGSVFRSAGHNGSSSSLVLGRVAGEFMPVLLQRDEQSRGLRFLVRRTQRTIPSTPNS